MVPHDLQETGTAQLMVSLELPDDGLRLGVLDEDCGDGTQAVLPETAEKDFARLRSHVASQLHLTYVQTNATEFRYAVLPLIGEW